MLPRRRRQLKDEIPLFNQPHRGQQRQHHIGGTIRNIEGAADLLPGPRMLREPGKQIEMDERRQQHVRRIQRIAHVVDVDGVGLRD